MNNNKALASNKMAAIDSEARLQVSTDMFLKMKSSFICLFPKSYLTQNYKLDSGEDQ